MSKEKINSIIKNLSEDLKKLKISLSKEDLLIQHNKDIFENNLEDKIIAFNDQIEDIEIKKNNSNEIIELNDLSSFLKLIEDINNVLTEINFKIEKVEDGTETEEDENIINDKTKIEEFYTTFNNILIFTE
jgi:hypothetical protein